MIYQIIQRYTPRSLSFIFISFLLLQISKEGSLIRSQKYIYFLQLAYKFVVYTQYARTSGIFQATRITRQYNPSNKFFTIGNYLVQANFTHWHLFKVKNNKIIQTVVRFVATQLKIDESMCNSNSFYANNTKFTIKSMKMKILKGNTTIILKNEQCSKTVNIQIVKQKQMIFTNNRALQATNGILQIQQNMFFGDRFQGILQINQKSYPYKLYKRVNFTLSNSNKIVNFVTIDEETVVFLQKAVNNLNYYIKSCKNTVCSTLRQFSLDYSLIQSYLGTFLHSVTKRPYFYIYLRKQKNSNYFVYYLNELQKIQRIIDEQLWTDASFTFLGVDNEITDQNFLNPDKVRFIFSLTNYHSNEIAHGIVEYNGYKIIQKYQLIVNGYQSCPNMKYQGEYVMLMYRFDEQELKLITIYNQVISNTVFPKQREYRFNILNQKVFPQYSKGQFKCLQNGVALLINSTIVLLDANLDISNTIILKGNVETDKFTLNHILHKSEAKTNLIEIIDLHNGFNIFNVQNVLLSDIVENPQSNGFMLKNGTYFNLQLPKIQIQQNLQAKDYIYLRIKNQTKQLFRIYEVLNLNTLQLLDNRFSLLIKNNILNDSIWNSTVDTIYQNGKKLSHIEKFDPDTQKQNLQSLKFDRDFWTYNLHFMANNQDTYVQIRSIIDAGRYSKMVYGLGDLYLQSRFQKAQILGAYIDNKTNQIYAKTRNQTHVCFFKYRVDAEVQNISYCFRKVLPYLMNLFQKNLEWDNQIQNKTFFTLQAGIANWNSSFTDTYSSTTNNLPKDVNLQYDNYYDRNKKIAIYTLENLKYEDIDASTFGMQEKLMDYAKIKRDNSIYLLILLQKHLILQKYHSKEFVSQKVDGKYINLQSCSDSELVYEYLLISSQSNHTILKINWLNYPRVEIFEFKQTLVNDKHKKMASGACLNKMALVMSMDQILYLYNFNSEKQNQHKIIYSIEKLDMYVIGNCQGQSQWWTRDRCIAVIKRINEHQFFVQMSLFNFIWFRLNQNLKLNPSNKMIKVQNQQYSKQYNILYSSSSQIMRQE